MKIKIVQVCPRYFPDIGGVETNVKEISERLEKRGFEVEVVCTKPFLKKKSFTKKTFLKKKALQKKLVFLLAQVFFFCKKKKCDEVINGVEVRRFRSFAPHDAYFIAPQIYFYLKRMKCDVIHAHSYHAFPAFFAALAKKDRKFVFTPHYHGKGHTTFRNLLHKPYKLLGSRTFRNSDKIICVSLHEKKLIKENFGIPENKLVHIPNGINLEEFENTNNNLTRNGKKILYVGRLEKYKGVHYIIEALAYLNEYKLVIVGKGPYERELRRLASILSVDHRIEWLKDLSREELLKQYKSAGIFVFLSSFEAFGITVAEAIASGIPCIVSETSALKEFVDDKICFGLSNPRNVAKLAEKIVKVSMSTEKFLNLPKPKDKIKSWDEVVDEYEKMYEKLGFLDC